MSRADFNRAWEERPRRSLTSHAQREKIAELADEAGIETPSVFWSHDAEKVIERLTGILREPTLGPM